MLLLMASCNGHSGEARLTGEFEHLEQGEFLIYSSDEGHARLDTLRLDDGEFTYSITTPETATLHILYPNQSELVVFANPGADITIKGDALNLSEVEVSGSEDNELYTAFRLETNGKSVNETKAVARTYLLEHPTLVMSRHLFATYFLNDSTPASEAKELYDSLCRACPEDIDLSKYAIYLRSMDKIKVGKALPDFSLTLKPGHGGNGDEERTIHRSDYKGKYLLIAFWSNWKSSSLGALYRLRRTRRELKAKGIDLELLSYSLDGDESRLTLAEKRDSVDYPSYCDFLTLSSPLAQQWNITTLPFYILKGPDGKIIACGSSWMEKMDAAINNLKK